MPKGRLASRMTAFERLWGDRARATSARPPTAECTPADASSLQEQIALCFATDDLVPARIDDFDIGWIPPADAPARESVHALLRP